MVLNLARVRCSQCAGCLKQELDSVRCVSCGHLFVIRDGKLFLIDQPGNAPIPKKDLTHMLRKASWSAWRRSNHAHILRCLADVPKNAAILDFGAGRAPFRHDVNESFSDVTSIDFVAYDLVDIVADLSGPIPLTDETFDVVIVSNVLEHLPKPELALQEIYRVLKKGGIIIAQTPFLMELHDEPYDFYRYTKYAASYLLETTGFTDTRIEPLSDVFDARRSLARGMYSEMIKRSNLIQRLIVRTLRKLDALILRTASLLAPALAVERHPKGYGWYGKKPFVH